MARRSQQPMPHNQLEHHRRSIRLAGYDYSTPGAYAITLVTQQRRCLYGEVAGGDMRLNAAGQMIEQCWRELAYKFPAVEIDVYEVMPNHFHGIIVIRETAVTKEGTIGAPLPDDEAIVTGEGAHIGAPRRDDKAIVIEEGVHIGAPLHDDEAIVIEEVAQIGAAVNDEVTAGAGAGDSGNWRAPLP